MKVEGAVEIIFHFFNDLIGALLPGIVLFFCMVMMHFGLGGVQKIVLFTDKGESMLVFIGLLFALGHTVLAFYQSIIKRVLSFHFKEVDKDGAQQKQPYILFLEIVKDKFPKDKISSEYDFHDLRSIALSISSEAASLGRRFMFISLLCNGMATVFIILLFDFILCLIFYPGLLYGYNFTLHWFLQIIILLIISYSLFKQGSSFYNRSMMVPFSVAIAEIKVKGIKGK